MHPAFSVIFFTTMSGAGYGLWFWCVFGAWPKGHGSMIALGWMLFTAFVLVSLGLLSSTLHLGKPLRAWRAFSQWRTSWLSREGISSIATYAPFVALAVMAATDSFSPAAVVIAGLWLAIGSLVTVACTAMIYASLKTIPAWSQPLVLPGYLLFALHTGGLLALAMLAITGSVGKMAGLAVLASCFVLWVLKRLYWRAIDRGEMPASRASALGLPADRTVRVFEHPHTEANYLTKEMGFVLARKHSRKLRVIAVVLFADLPALCAMAVLWLPHASTAPWLLVAAISALLGAFVERWLFFAEARHVVMLYY